jgi:hypothetical protein
MKQIKLVAYTAFILIVLSACLETSEPNIPNQFRMSFNTGDVGTTIQRDGNTLEVNEIKFLLKKFQLETDTQTKLETNVGALTLGYAQQNDENVGIVQGEIPFKDIDTFNALDLTLAPVDEDSTVPDQDFREGTQIYSVVIKGNYNGSSFEYTSDPSHTITLPFGENITLDSNTLQILLLNNVQNFMIDPADDSILSPNDGNDAAKIDSLIGESFSIQANKI